MELSKEKKKAILVIRNYLNRDFTEKYILDHFELAIDELIESAASLKAMKVAGVKSMSEGNQSVTFADNVEAWTITDNVKALLPVPFVRMW